MTLKVRQKEKYIWGKQFNNFLQLLGNNQIPCHPLLGLHVFHS